MVISLYATGLTTRDISSYLISSPIIRALMQTEGLIFIEKYKESQMLRIVTDMEVEFTPVVVGKSKSKVAPKTQKSRHKAETFDVASNKQTIYAYIRYPLGWLQGIEP